MNSDSFLDSDFFQDNKAIITILTTVSLAFFTIYWLYRGLKPEENISNQSSQNRNLQNNIQNYMNNNINSNNLNNSLSNQNNIVNSNIPKPNSKRRLLINASSVLIENMENIDIGKIYQFLSPLSEIFDLYLLFLIKEDNEIQQIGEKLEVLTEDKIIFKHVCNLLFLIFLLNSFPIWNIF